MIGFIIGYFLGAIVCFVLLQILDAIDKKNDD